MFSQLRMLVVAMFFVPALAVAGDIEARDVHEFLSLEVGPSDTMDQINRDIEAKPTAAGESRGDGMDNKERLVPGTLNVHFNPNLLFVPGTSQGDL